LPSLACPDKEGGRESRRIRITNLVCIESENKIERKRRRGKGVQRPCLIEAIENKRKGRYAQRPQTPLPSHTSTYMYTYSSSKSND